MNRRLESMQSYVVCDSWEKGTKINSCELEDVLLDGGAT